MGRLGSAGRRFDGSGRSQGHGGRGRRSEGFGGTGGTAVGVERRGGGAVAGVSTWGR